MTEEDMNRYLSVCKERDILQANLAEWAELHSRHASMVIPGETDSADSYRRIWFEMKAKLECAERYKADADRSLALMALALEAKKSPDTHASPEIEAIREALKKVPRHHRDKWFFAPEKSGRRRDRSEYHLDAHIAYGTEGDDSDTFDLIDSYDLNTYRFIAACNPLAIEALLARVACPEKDNKDA